jgi:hypothetical protein
MFKEAYSLDKWKEIYGSIIMPNLSNICFFIFLLVYCMAMVGNITMAQHYLNEYQNNFGEFGIEDSDYHNL